MKQIEMVNILENCFQNICKNFNVPASLRLSSFACDRSCPTVLIKFLDVHASSDIAFDEIEVLQQLQKQGIKSKKDYRRLRALVRIKLIEAVRDLHDLTYESLRNLGAED